MSAEFCSVRVIRNGITLPVVQSKIVKATLRAASCWNDFSWQQVLSVGEVNENKLFLFLECLAYAHAAVPLPQV